MLESSRYRLGGQLARLCDEGFGDVDCFQKWLELSFIREAERH